MVGKFDCHVGYTSITDNLRIFNFYLFYFIYLSLLLVSKSEVISNIWEGREGGFGSSCRVLTIQGAKVIENLGIINLSVVPR